MTSTIDSLMAEFVRLERKLALVRDRLFALQRRARGANAPSGDPELKERYRRARRRLSTKRHRDRYADDPDHVEAHRASSGRSWWKHREAILARRRARYREDHPKPPNQEVKGELVAPE